MNKYIAYFDNASCQSLRLYSIKDSPNSSKSFSGLDELVFLEDTDTLIVLIPSLLVSSYKSLKNNDVPKDIYLANFISNIDTKTVSQISENKIKFHNDVGFVINESIIENLNKSLTLLDANIYLTPEYSFFSVSGKNVITEFDKKYIISNSDGTGTSILLDSMEDYINLIKNVNPDFKPLIYSNSNNLKEKFPENKFLDFSLSSFLEKNISSLPNFYEFYYSFNTIKNKLSYSIAQISILCLSAFAIILLPILIINKNNNDANIYKNATFNIFKSINSDIKKVVRPRSQIDAIMSQIPLTKSEDSFKMPSLNLLDQVDIENIENIFIDFNQSTVSILIKDMPPIQYNLFKVLAKQTNIKVLSDKTSLTNNNISGSITVNLINE